MVFSQGDKEGLNSLSPLSKGISSQKVKLKKRGNNCLESQLSGRFHFIIIPLIVLTIVLGALYAAGALANFGFKNYFGLIVFLLILSLLLRFLHKKQHKKIFFDLQNKSYSIGDQTSRDTSDILGIQLLTYHHPVSGHYRIRFELNLCMKDGSRIHLFNNSSYQLASRQAQQIASALSVELWDETNP